MHEETESRTEATDTADGQRELHTIEREERESEPTRRALHACAIGAVDVNPGE